MSIAIVTGASSGIGAEFCRRLDEKGLDCIWMIARRTELLQNISSTLDTPTRIFSVDLSDRESLSSFNSLIEKEGPSISYLVNCAGLGKFGKTWEISDESTLSMIDLNITALVEITRTCIPFMKKGGHIIEFCSESAYIPLYELNVYASTKAFVRHFCGGLRHELKDREVSVTEVSPGWVQTDFIEKSMSENNAPKKVFNNVVTKEDVVEDALRCAEKGKARSVCGWKNKAIVVIGTHCPNFASKIWRSNFD